VETSALGAAMVAGLGCGLYEDIATLTKLWQADQEFIPHMSAELREKNYLGWQRAVKRVQG
jgi:glycerol kinase